MTDVLATGRVADNRDAMLLLVSNVVQMKGKLLVSDFDGTMTL
jgi:hypothetical protein